MVTQEIKHKVKVVWNNLKNKYNGVYLDLKQINQLNKRGLEVII